MGCPQSKSREPTKVPAACFQRAEGKAAGNLLAAPKNPAEVLKAELMGIPFVAKEKHHADPIIMMCSYFKILPEKLGPWKEHCDEFYKAAMETEGLLSYGMAFNEGGVHVRQGYRSAAALLEHLCRADRPLTEALKHSTLQRVEVHGARRHLAEVKGQMTRIGECFFQFFETHSKMTGIRRPTEFSGQPGSDTLVSCHVSIKVAEVTELRALAQKTIAVHRRARCSPGNESFGVSQCLEQGVATLMASFDSMEAAVEHLAYIAAHLGADVLSALEMHGPEAEIAKLRASTGKAGVAPEAASSMLQNALAVAAKRGAEDAREAKACAEAAARVAASVLSEAAKEAREQMAPTIEALHKRAEKMAQEIYRDAMKAAGATKCSAKARADRAYERAMQAASEVRQAADQAARESYEVTVAAGVSVEQALEVAHRAAGAAARSIHGELVDMYKAARSKEKAAAVEDAGDAAQRGAKEALEAAKMAADLSWQVFEGVFHEAWQESRQATLCARESLKRTSEEVVEALYQNDREAEAATEMIKTAADRARAAAWAVVSTSEHVYCTACEEALAAGKEPEQAREAAAKSVEAAADKAVAVWRRGEQLDWDAVRATESMASQEERVFEKVCERSTTYVLDAERAFRRSLYSARVAVEEEIHEATEDAAWAIDCVVEEAAGDRREARAALLGRIQAWHDALAQSEAGASRVVADAAEAQDNRADRRQKACCC